jgi:hypothetical protein
VFVISSVSAFALVAIMRVRARNLLRCDDRNTSEIRPVMTNHGFLS